MKKNYEITVPFRRKNRNKADILVTLYKIFQAQEGDNHDPMCNHFPSFKLNGDPKMFAGCIKNYIDATDFTTNPWIYYPSKINNIQAGDVPSELDKLTKLHFVHFNSDNQEAKTISCRRKYIFPIIINKKPEK